MKLINSSKLIASKSKFFGFLFKIDSLDEISEIVENVREKDKKFCHICYGICFDKEEIFKNDSEVGQPGKILLDVLKNNGMCKHCLVVGRIFGGVKLGPARVGKSFREAGKKCFIQSS